MFDDFYGLSGRPFQLTPDPSFYFESLSHRKALSYLGYGLAQGEGFVVITGEVGAGKSTLVAHLMAMIDPARLTAAQVVTSRLDGEEIVHVVAQAFGLIIDGHDKASALGAIETFLHDEARAGRRCLLIVDESQNLSVEALEELRMLSNFQLGAHPLLQTLLLGQPEFRDTLADHPDLEQLRQRVIAAHHLDAMQPVEVQQYVEHRLKCVGWAGNPAFDQRVFAEIFKVTGGIPRRINQIANRLLLLGAVEQRTRIDGAMVQQVIAELTEDGSVALLRPVPEPVATPEPAPVEPEAAEEPVTESVEDYAEEITTAEIAAPDPAEDTFSDQAEHFAEESTSEEIDEAENAENRDAVLAHDCAREAEPAELSEDAAELEETPQALQAPVPDEERQEFRVPTGPAGTSDLGDLQAILADRDAQIAELQQAVLELSDAAEDGGQPYRASSEQIDALGERIAAIESRLIEQDRTIRHTLTMLIEWIETGEGERDVA